MTRFDPRSAAAAIGFPPLAPAGEAILRSVHEAVEEVWACSGRTLAFPELLEAVRGASRAAYSSEAAAEALNLTAGVLATRFGTISQPGAFLADLLLDGFALERLGAVIGAATDLPDALYAQRNVILSLDGSMLAGKTLMPATDHAELTVAVFIDGPSEHHGSIDTSAGSLSWRFSGGIVALTTPDSVASADVSADWSRVAIAAAASLASAPMPVS